MPCKKSFRPLAPFMGMVFALVFLVIPEPVSGVEHELRVSAGSVWPRENRFNKFVDGSWTSGSIGYRIRPFGPVWLGVEGVLARGEGRSAGDASRLRFERRSVLLLAGMSWAVFSRVEAGLGGGATVDGLMEDVLPWQGSGVASTTRLRGLGWVVELSASTRLWKKVWLPLALQYRRSQYRGGFREFTLGEISVAVGLSWRFGRHAANSP